MHSQFHKSTYMYTCNEWAAIAVLDSKVHWANMGPPGADRTHVGPMLAQWALFSGTCNLQIQ